MAWYDRKAQLVKGALALTGQPDRTTDRTRKSIELAVTAACEYASPIVDSRHLLCGLMCEGQGVAYNILNQLGLKRERLEQMLVVAMPSGSASLPRLDDDLTAALSACWTLATTLHHNYIGTEHLLLGIVGTQTRALELLRRLGFEGNAIDSDIRQLLGAPT